ncbi:MAG: AEC family transporter [Desulfarculaceae bacterium]|nr:AEC family transporter [Desulfarculaceae bacterium]MCF8048754.1 AEC family transporter [Desulfarculaceae bacterium]MCF8098860.1 AEC family transporter [Desulfarculaceae bacterium]MCF8122892.1 AEC family transporter [Desulfarculaceae bacterium]
MDFQIRVLSSIAVLVGLICLAVLLRKLKVLDESHGALFAKLVSQVTLPATIFVYLVEQPIPWCETQLAGIMFLAEVVCLVLAWLVGRCIGLDRPRLGAFILTAGFGSSALLGYALVSEAFPGQAQAIVDAVIISELGVGPALFTIGVMVAIYFGGQQVGTRERVSAALAFFRSPIFFALALGLICASFGLPIHNPVVASLLDGLKVVAGANTLAVALTVGLILRLNVLSAGVGLVAAVCAIKLILKPLLVWLPLSLLDLPDLGKHILILEAAMPSALLGVVLAKRYGCDGGLAAKLAFSTTIAGGATIVLVAWLMI